MVLEPYSLRGLTGPIRPSTTEVCPDQSLESRWDTIDTLDPVREFGRLGVKRVDTLPRVSVSLGCPNTTPNSLCYLPFPNKSSRGPGHLLSLLVTVSNSDNDIKTVFDFGLWTWSFPSQDTSPGLRSPSRRCMGLASSATRPRPLGPTRTGSVGTSRSDVWTREGRASRRPSPNGHYMSEGDFTLPVCLRSFPPPPRPLGPSSTPRVRTRPCSLLRCLYSREIFPLCCSWPWTMPSTLLRLPPHLHRHGRKR